jgi:hypothetical protein
MNTKLLIDAIVRQTTVLIAQLSTAAGIPRAARALYRRSGLPRSVAGGRGARGVTQGRADMFGLAIRTLPRRRCSE